MSAKSVVNIIGACLLSLAWASGTKPRPFAFFGIHTNYHTNSYEPEEFEHVYKKILLTEKYIPCNSQNIEEELSNILATEIGASIDAEILGSLIDLENEWFYKIIFRRVD